MHNLSEKGTAAGNLHEGMFKIAKSLSFKICKIAAEEREGRTLFYYLADDIQS